MNKNLIIFFGFFIAAVLPSCENKVGRFVAPKAVVNVCDSIKYSAHIKPIILANCAFPGCHVAGFSSGDFTTYAGLNSKITNGKFKARVIDANPGPMPASGQLSKPKLDSIKCWLDRGAPND
ncbi:MAG: hypothetical protein H0U95_00670 [Bacteroidetes bacterium]|nr:hypothetical protein [Bacteroidota bacterium]